MKLDKKKLKNIGMVLAGCFTIPLFLALLWKVARFFGYLVFPCNSEHSICVGSDITAVLTTVLFIGGCIWGLIYYFDVDF